MKVALKRISTAIGLLAALSTSALGQGSAPSANQLTADSVASSLRASQSLTGHRIEIETRDGVVTLTGNLANVAQKSEALARAQHVAGVRGVVDHLSISTDRSVRTTQYQMNAGPNRPNPALAMGLGRMGGQFGGDVIYDGGAGGPMAGGMGNNGPVNGGFMGGGPMNGGFAGGGPMNGGFAGGGPGNGGFGNGAPTSAASFSDGGPIPEGPAGMAGATQAAQPGAPNYAWPSYAPYPNFSAVGYPTAYPWQAWPNIGPFYPYPEVPQDWRAVTLRWDDGVWWLDFKKHYTRPFFTPYPFGLFAY